MIFKALPHIYFTSLLRVLNWKYTIFGPIQGVQTIEETKYGWKKNYYRIHFKICMGNIKTRNKNNNKKLSKMYALLLNHIFL